METSKNDKREPFKETLTVKKIIFQTGMKGNIMPIVMFHDTKLLKKHNINAAIFRDYEILAKINKGSRAIFKFDENLIPEMETIIKEAKEPIKLPTACPSCGTRLETKKGTLSCPNHFCTGTSRGFLYRLLKLAWPLVALEFMEKYLDEYYHLGKTISIDNPQEFKNIFCQTLPKNTQGIENGWIKHHNETHAPILWKMDLKVEEYLSQKEIEASHFWSICNFPKLQENELYELCSIDPTAFINGECRAEFNALSKRVRDLLMNNYDFVSFLHSLFVFFGSKQWKLFQKS